MWLLALPSIMYIFKVFFSWEGRLLSKHKQKRTLFVWPIISSEQLMTGQPHFFFFFLFNSFFPSLTHNVQAFLPSLVVSLVYVFILSHCSRLWRAPVYTISGEATFATRDVAANMSCHIHDDDRNPLMVPRLHCRCRGLPLFEF